MKTFLNVLYRRILYKIPLKLLLFLLAIFGVLFACFSSADYTLPTANWEGNYYLEDGAFRYSRDLISFTLTTETVSVSNEYNFFCFRSNSNNSSDWSSYSLDNSIWNGSPGNQYFCTDEHIIYFKCQQSNNCQVNFFYYKEGEGFIPNKLSSLQCQTEYNLIPISSVDQNYCISNNLCPSCPVCPSVPVCSGGYSQLYINNILHLGASNIIMNIPDEIDWDYAYTNSGQNMNIDVVGYNVDYEKIDSIVQFQNYKPTSEDFQKIIGLLAPYIKIIVFFVFLFIVWAWVKKPFKSKKL